MERAAVYLDSVSGIHQDLRILHDGFRDFVRIDRCRKAVNAIQLGVEKSVSMLLESSPDIVVGGCRDQII